MNSEKIKIIGHHVEITEALSEAVHKKFSHLLKHYDKFVSSIEIILRIDNHKIQIAEANAHLPKSFIVNATAESEDMYESIEKLSDKIKHQFDTYKGKFLEHRVKN